MLMLQVVLSSSRQFVEIFRVDIKIHIKNLLKAPLNISIRIKHFTTSILGVFSDSIRLR